MAAQAGDIPRLRVAVEDGEARAAGELHRLGSWLDADPALSGVVTVERREGAPGSSMGLEDELLIGLVTTAVVDSVFRLLSAACNYLRNRGGRRRITISVEDTDLRITLDSRTPYRRGELEEMAERAARAIRRGLPE
ncbi:hypothetical protein GCM10009716_35730 [Streptomyces sodiiphilus]|uniref:Uncharacterized protein n=1 Tax=Streptomyces sodiiphilus TaxID=226217 RepID=A0ABN2PMB4_9ACTN